jgi:hypothetical protein
MTDTLRIDRVLSIYLCALAWLVMTEALHTHTYNAVMVTSIKFSSKLVSRCGSHHVDGLVDIPSMCCRLNPT